MTWTRPAQPWCEVQGSVDGKPFLHYESDSNKAKPLGPVGEKVNTTKTWEEQTETLKDLRQELRNLLPDIALEKYTTMGKFGGAHILETVSRRRKECVEENRTDGERELWQECRVTSLWIGSRPLTLQVKLVCQRQAEQYTGASWQFSIHGQLLLLIDTVKTNCTAGHPGAMSIKEKWQKDRRLAEYFRKISQANCNDWLREFLVI
ncbi:UL16-binding protein 1-like [Trichechus inunguis]